MTDKTEAMDNLIAQDADLIDLKPTQADIDAMESILWVETTIDDQEAIAKAFARHRLAERAAIVAWLRKLSGYDATTPTFQDRRLAYQLAALEFSNAIEAGEHLK